MSFVHLHNHTHYSLLDGLTKIDEMVNFAKEQGSPAIAITDHGNMYGVIEFYQKAKKAGIKPIIGVEAYLASATRFNKNTREDRRSFHLLLLAKNNQGYKNLIKLTSKAYIEGFYYKPRIDWDLLKEYHEGLIASSACLAGEIPRLIIAGKLKDAEKRIKEYDELFGRGNFYLEIMDHPELPELEKINKALIEFSKKLGVPLIATNDVHYLKKEDDEAQDILLCLQNKKKITDTDRMKMIGKGDYSLRSNSEMISAFSHIPEAIENTVKIAEKCNVEIELGKIQLPFFEVPKGYDGNSYLRLWCEKGIEQRFPKATNIELKNINPLKYDLLFERFLNPERISMPDIDLDFADVRRGEVLNYVGEKYGHDHVAQIITFGTMAARAAIRDVGRVLDAPYEYCDKISKSIPMFNKLAEALKAVPELREMYQNEPMAKKIIDYAMRLYGVAIYQEQGMQIAPDLAGFSMAQADVLRKAMVKKIVSLLAEQKEKFIDGCVKNGVYKELAEKVFSFIEPFAGYGFNRSHAACYAMIGYQTAYLKAHWPLEFMAALLTADQGDSDRIAIEIDECRNMGIKIMAPNVNESFGTFTVVTEGTKENKTVNENIKADTIRFGLKAIKNVGEHIVDEIIKERKASGPFLDIFSLLKRVTDKDLNKKSLESLIKSGAMEDFGERGLLLANLEKFLTYNKEEAKSKASMQESLFGALADDEQSQPELIDALPVEQNEKLNWEKELLGLYVSEHPFNLFKPYLEGYTLSLASLSGHKNDARITTAGIISTIKKIITRKGDSMIFVKIEDALSSSELLIFPRLYKETMDIWEEGRALIVAGKISEKDQDIKILADKVAILNLEDPKKSINDFKKMMLDFPIKKNRYQNNFSQNQSSTQGSKMISEKKKEVKEDKIKEEEKFSSKNSLRLSLPDNFSASDLVKLKSVFTLFSGNDDVYFRLVIDGKYKVIKTDFKVNEDSDIKEKIKSMFKNEIKIAD